EIGVAAEDAPAGVVPGTPGEPDIALDELCPGEWIDVIGRVRIVEPCRDPPALVNLVGDAIGGDPLLAALGAGVAPPFELALPVGVGRCTAEAHADRAPVDNAAQLVAQFARLIG